MNLPKKKMPAWLSGIQCTDHMKKISIKKILKNSLYYPCSGRDGDPVKFLGGFIYSFIYVDNRVTINQVTNSLHNSQRNFRGYMVEYELYDFFRIDSVWVILKRCENYKAKHGPNRLSFLYVFGDGQETFKELYIANQSYPHMVALIKSGWMGSDNYDKDGNLARAILNNENGCPLYMLECVEHGKIRQTNFWGKHPYQVKLTDTKGTNHYVTTIGLWFEWQTKRFPQLDL